MHARTRMHVAGLMLAIHMPSTSENGFVWVQVYLNGKHLPIKSFQDYVGLYLKDKDTPRVYEKVNDRWEICICASEGQFQQVRSSHHLASCPVSSSMIKSSFMKAQISNSLRGAGQLCQFHLHCQGRHACEPCCGPNHQVRELPPRILFQDCHQGCVRLQDICLQNINMT